MQNDFLKQTLKYFLVSAFAVVCTAGAAFGQETAASQQPEEDESTPPPVISLSSGEQSQLRAENDLKRRTMLCLQLADARLQRAEAAANGENFQDALVELGGYQAVVDHGLRFLQSNNDDSRRVRDNFRRMEIALRAYVPRIEMIRRTTPFEYAIHLKTIMNFTRDARSRALDSFFSDTVYAGNNQPGAETNPLTTEKKP